jgi:hypothetical protein
LIHRARRKAEKRGVATAILETVALWSFGFDFSGKEKLKLARHFRIDRSMLQCQHPFNLEKA